MKRTIPIALVIILSVFNLKVDAKIILPSIISDHMVLQQNTDVAIWGLTTDLTEKISVWGSWQNSDTVTTQAFQGKWKIKIPTPTKGGSYQVFIKGKETITIDDVLIGEVWLGSGQSNMEMPLDSVKTYMSGILDYKNEISQATYPKIRIFHVPKTTNEYPQQDCKAEWKICTPENIGTFSATLYFFGREIHNNLQVPVGLINSSWSGTQIRVWIDTRDSIGQPNELGLAKKYKPGKVDPRNTGKAFNAMINPIIPFTISGAIWYQGESNRWQPKTYEALQNHMVNTWREKWGYDFPFYYVQIAPFNYKNGINTAYLREAQLKAMNQINTGMIVTNDLVDNIDDVHPKDKKSVGIRLANWALAKTYRIEGIYYSGPIYQSMEIEGNKIRISFDHSEPGLIKRGKKLTQFTIAGKDRNFVAAEARIEDDEVIVWSKKVKNPVAVRFAFDNMAVHNFFNKAGLPASPFRTDDWEEE